MLSEGREFQIFVKPVGAECNLRCRYCYYLEKKALYQSGGTFIMADDVLEKYIVQNIRASVPNAVNFSWHGGEPLIAGIDFYRKAINFQRRYRPQGSVIINGIQTNGTLLDEEWCRFLADEQFVVGISMDGPGDLHDSNRKTRGGKKTLHSVVRGFDLLKKHGLIAEILCVVSAENVKYPLKVYNFFKQLGALYITFLPLVIRQPELPSGVSPDSVPAEEFGHFLQTVFDEWVENDIGKIKIQIFEEAARTAFDQEHTLCIFRTNCGGVPVLGHTGDFYSCDHYVNKEYLIGNINDQTLSDFLDCDRQKAFGKAKSLTLPGYCLSCEVLPMCNGECPKNRFISTPDGEPGLNYLCSGYRYFFNHCLPFVRAIREAWKSRV